jgi:hypothetical protein
LARVDLHAWHAVLPSGNRTSRRFAHATVLSLLFLYEGIRNLFASVDRGDDYKEGAAGDYEAKFAVADVAFIVWAMSVCHVEV